MASTPPTASASSPLDSMVCFAIYAAANAVTQAHRAVLEKWSLSYTQYIALVELTAASDGVTVSDLGARMALDSSTLSPLLSRLQERGLVHRERSTRDARVVVVRATDAGRTVTGELAEAIGCVASAYGFASRDQADELIASLHRLTDGMRALTANTRA
ncbi:MarR family winged helix-turn-helix transcriptional regulator [Rathayibacter sp. YIM 133350]|uniref:MarR family winged helix-turn-helix transcriptional regulator n=1 Tax=Rathayibacter sp. YIM 133350 TaxID=3131992 RepID=UPI00307CCD0D